MHQSNNIKPIQPMETIFTQLSEEQLTTLMRKAVRAEIQNETKAEPPQEFIRGIISLAKFLKVSAPRAQQLKNSGVFPYWQSGRTVLFDPAKVREAMQNVKTGKVRK